MCWHICVNANKFSVAECWFSWAGLVWHQAHWRVRVELEDAWGHLTWNDFLSLRRFQTTTRDRRWVIKTFPHRVSSCQISVSAVLMCSRLYLILKDCCMRITSHHKMNIMYVTFPFSLPSPVTLYPLLTLVGPGWVASFEDDFNFKADFASVAIDTGSGVWGSSTVQLSDSEEKGWATFTDFQPFCWWIYIWKKSLTVY